MVRGSDIPLFRVYCLEHDLDLLSYEVNPCPAEP